VLSPHAQGVCVVAGVAKRQRAAQRAVRSFARRWIRMGANIDEPFEVRFGGLACPSS
jgi:hypothetical protein